MTPRSARTNAAQDGTASIERVISFLGVGEGESSASENTRRGRVRRQTSDNDCRDEDLETALEKLRDALKLGNEREVSPRRLFQDLDEDGAGEVSHLVPLQTERGHTDA